MMSREHKSSTKKKTPMCWSCIPPENSNPMIENATRIIPKCSADSVQRGPQNQKSLPTHHTRSPNTLHFLVKKHIHRPKPPSVQAIAPPQFQHTQTHQ